MVRNLEFARFLEGRMQELDIGQSELARKVGVSPTAVWNWKAGTQPKSGLIGALAEALRVDPVHIARLTGHQAVAVATRAAMPAGLADRLAAAVATLPADRLQTLLDFAEHLGMKDWREEQQRLALANLARAYGDDEPDYTLADIQP